MNKAAIIFNPAAGSSKLVNHIEDIADKLRAHYDDVTIYETKERGDGARYVTKIASDVQLIVSAGGDGTVHELINALCPLASRPMLAILPGGTCNDFSRAIGMSQEPMTAIEQIIKHRIEKVDVGKFGDHYFLNFWGIGLLTEVSANIDDNLKEKVGKISYYISAAKTIRGYESFAMRMESELYEYEGDACLVLIGNGSYIGGMKTFFPESDIQDGYFEILVIKETTIELACQAIQTKITSTIPDSENIIHFKAKKLTIAAKPQQEIDCDGESAGLTPVELENLRRYLDVVVGDFQATEPGTHEL